MQYRLILGDALEKMGDLQRESVTAIVTDPPYNLQDMGAWDTAIAFCQDVWREALRVLKPGGHLVAFSSPRTYHRLAIAIEDAGFELRDQLIWLHLKGMAKGPHLPGGAAPHLKPAHEPIVLARKPFAGRILDALERHGTGALYVDACRVGDEPSPSIERRAAHARRVASGEVAHPRGTPGSVTFTRNGEASAASAHFTREIPGEALGRFPANVTSDGAADLYIERSDRYFYTAKASRQDRSEGLPEGQRNPHPTVKPTDLMRWLVRLVTPRGGTVLDPFMGSGSTGKACALEARDFIGIDITPEYLPVAEARIRHAIEAAPTIFAEQVSIQIGGTPCRTS